MENQEKMVRMEQLALWASPGKEEKLEVQERLVKMENLAETDQEVWTVTWVRAENRETLDNLDQMARKAKKEHLASRVPQALQASVVHEAKMESRVLQETQVDRETTEVWVHGEKRVSVENRENPDRQDTRDLRDKEVTVGPGARVGQKEHRALMA